MDFFDHQQRAQRNTTRLVVLFLAATVAIIALLYLVGILVMRFVEMQQELRAMPGDPGAPGVPGETIGWFHPPLLLGVTLGTLAIVFGGMAYKVSSLRGGGRVVAEMLGGRLIDPGATDLHERKILNVVEEMAIASGVVVPPVYLMEREAGINAFAAGYGPDDAVIGVTRGCIELLSRDELQGVMAHEFSHIVNGDMRLNIRLIGVIFGILVIGFIGQMLVRSALYSGHVRRRGSKDSGGGVLLMVAIGAAMFIIGAVGVFFGKLIKAAISRQREFLADAAAVQFTRNPDGIGGALKKIGGYTYGSKVVVANAEEASHMFFGDALDHVFGFMLATHPPLAERIRRVDPGWDGSFPAVAEPQHVEKKRQAKQEKLSRPAPARHGLATMAAPMLLAAEEAGNATATIGQPSAAHLRYARELVAAIPAPLRDAAHEPFGARAAIYALLLDADRAVAARQLAYLSTNADPQVYDLTQRLTRHLQALNPNARLPLIDMAMPALRELAPEQFQAFRKNVVALIRADDHVELFEWVLSRILLRHLDPHFAERARRPVTQYYNLKPVAPQCALLLSALAYLGSDDEEAAHRAFQNGAAQLGLAGLTLAPRSEAGFAALDKALAELERTSPREKRKVVAACAACIAADRQVTGREGEVLRAIADALACPIPPLLPGQPIM